MKPEDAIVTWNRLRALTERTGYYPLVFRDPYRMLEELESLGQASTEDYLRAAAEVDGRWWLKRQAELEDREESPLPRGEFEGEGIEAFAVPSFRWSYAKSEEMLMLLLPTKKPWEVAAFMGFGGWNACPNPENHVAVWLYWHEAFGAEPVTMTHDVVEMLVSRRPGSREQALELAMEQFTYCQDIVTQGVGTVDALAATLLKSKIWFFWWD